MKREKKDKQAVKLQKLFNKLHVFERIIFRKLYPYRKHGNVRKYDDGALIIVGNHFSVFDVIYSAMVTDRPIHYMAKNELFDHGFTKWLTKNVECIPVKRDGSDVQAVKTALRYLKNGDVVNIFPEGTRNHTYDSLLPFHSGAAALSIKTRTPILPIAIVGKCSLGKKIDVIYGEPIEFRQYYGKKMTAEQLEECDRELRFIIWNMRQAFIDKNHPKLPKIK